MDDVEVRRKAWNEQGFFYARGLLTAGETKALEAEIIQKIRDNPPSDHPGETIYFAGPNYAIFPEKEASGSAQAPEDFISKVFNCHAEGLALGLARRQEIVARVAEILGPDLDCFQSQFILKNPGVIGQPWHQDSYYFRLDRQPQVGVWVALSAATLENGCLWVLPGSHDNDILEHVPDRRPAANRGYLEVVSEDDSARIPCLMEPGDVLFFHSYLLHMSTDNVADHRRTALVYHYGRAGSRPISESAARALAHVNRWIPVARSRAEVPA